MACAQPWATARGPGDAPNPLTPASDAAGVAHALPAQRKATTDSMHATLRAQPTTACAPSSKARPHSTGNAADTPTLASSEAALRKSCLQRSARQPAHPMHAAQPGGHRRHLRPPPRLTAHTPHRPGRHRQPQASSGCVAGKPPPGWRNCGAKLADNMRPLDAALPRFPVAACPSLPLLPPRWHTSVHWASGRPPRWWSAA